MKVNFFRRILFSIIIISTYSSLVAQEKQYIINEDRSKVSLLIEKENDTNFTVANIQNRGRLGQPLLEARLYELDIKMDTIGTWSTLSTDENIWKLTIEVPDAKAFFISFDEFYLPKGSQLYVYKEGETKESFSFINEDNPKGGAYSIEDLIGENVVLEYVAAENITEKPRLHISNLGYKYLDDQDQIYQPDYFNNKSNACMTNTICPKAAEWDAQKRGVVRLRIVYGTHTELCSGTLINNVKNDKKPYVLTAEHCFEKVPVRDMPSVAANTEFFFEYESPTCETTTRPIYKYHKGSSLLVRNPIAGGSDAVLLELSEPIPDYWNVYFNGWDRENNGSNITSGSVIHHPLGDVKKITFYNSKLVSTTWPNIVGNPSNSHWLVVYSDGVTNGGSSGSPIFNQNGLVVGTLTGGYSECEKPNEPDYFGKLWYHFDQGSDPSWHMNTYLDPDNTDAIKIAGLENNENAVKNLIIGDIQKSIAINNQATVEILSGNGGYAVSSSDDNIVSARISETTITLLGRQLGKATVTLIDREKKTAEIEVAVVNNIEVYIVNNTLTIKSYDTDDTIGEVQIVELSGNYAYRHRSVNATEHSVNTNTIGRGTYILKVKTKKGHTLKEKITW